MKFSHWLAIGVGIAFLFVPLERRSDQRFDFTSFGRLPVLEGGRMKPLDTIARNALLVLSGKQQARSAQTKERKTAIEWLAAVLFHPQDTYNDPVFEIDDPDVLGLLHIEPGKNRRFPFSQIYPFLEEIELQASRADQVKAPERSRFHSSILVLYGKLVIFHKLQNTLQTPGEHNTFEALKSFQKSFAVALEAHAKSGKSILEIAPDLPLFQARAMSLSNNAHFFSVRDEENPHARDGWVSVGAALSHGIHTDGFPPIVWISAKLGDAYRAGDSSAFHHALLEYHAEFARLSAKTKSLIWYEYYFNKFAPFYKCLLFYVVVFLLVFVSWLKKRASLLDLSFVILVLAFVVHSVGLISRMVIQGRPPVTNLYSSAIFVGWAAVFLGMMLERRYKNGVGGLAASFVGFVTLIIAHHLAVQGDTLEMMRAVLDSNFWLATHVVTITIGYSSTFLSGALGIIYLAARLWDKTWSQQKADTLTNMAFGVVCFSTLFSFLGTVLGGIWADQSWGRFWGWDPKENGALMIVLWNVFMLHARWGGIIRQRGFMVMAVFGNVITALSWFGVNMLGIGLHSYGFMDKAFVWLVLFIISQLAIMSLGLIRGREYTSTPSRPRRPGA